jgi:hypothetical protein
MLERLLLFFIKAVLPSRNVATTFPLLREICFQAPSIGNRSPRKKESIAVASVWWRKKEVPQVETADTAARGRSCF